MISRFSFLYIYFSVLKKRFNFLKNKKIRLIIIFLIN